MSLLTEEVKARITAETESIDSPQASVIADYICRYVLTTDENAAKVLEPNKDIETFLGMITEEARKKQKNRRAVMTSFEVLPMLHNYLGIAPYVTPLTTASAEKPRSFKRLSLD